MTIHENLTKTKAMIADKANWCTNSLENDEEQHCIVGAVSVVRFDNAHSNFVWLTDEIKKLDDAAEKLYPEFIAGVFENTYGNFKLHEGLKIVEVNNTLGHEAMLKCLDYAITKEIEGASQ